jgi:SAM-dependent methyltransferase
MGACRHSISALRRRNPGASLRAPRASARTADFGLRCRAGTRVNRSPNGVVAPGSRIAALVRRSSDWVDLAWWTLERVLRELAPQARGRLLDVGCGDRPWEALFAPHVSEYVGLEHAATFSRTSAARSGRGPDLVYDGERLPFEDRSFDTIINIQVLEHTPSPAALVQEMARVLRDDGTLLLAAPFAFRLHEQPHDYFRYTPYGLASLCNQAGLEVVEVHTCGNLWSLIGHKLNTYLALRVARIGSVAQTLGKLGHETPTEKPARLWTLPLVAPSMLAISTAARLFDRVLEEPEETLGFVIVARRNTTESE